MYDAHCKITGDYVVGGVKLSIAIRLLTSGDEYGVSLIFDAHFDYVKIIF